MSQKVFEQIWTQLRGKKATYKDFLERVTIKELGSPCNLMEVC